MEVKNDYNETLTNLACSIRKYFELDYKHKTLDYRDKILKEKKPKNVVTILFDGMGSNIIDKIQKPFEIKNSERLLKNAIEVFSADKASRTSGGSSSVELGRRMGEYISECDN